MFKRPPFIIDCPVKNMTSGSICAQKISPPLARIKGGTSSSWNSYRLVTEAKLKVSRYRFHFVGKGQTFACVGLWYEKSMQWRERKRGGREERRKEGAG